MNQRSANRMLIADVSRDEINGWAQTCLRICEDTATASLAARRARRQETCAALAEAHARAWRLMKALVEAGAVHPVEKRLFEHSTGPGISALELLDTPANWRLLDALMDAHQAALEVDRERGEHATGLAEVLEHFAVRVAEEVRRYSDRCSGPSGS